MIKESYSPTLAREYPFAPSTPPQVETSAGLPFALSLVVPTKNEAGNIALLLTRVKQATPDLRLEVIFVDDSSDETPQVIQSLRDQFAPLEVVLVARPPEQRHGGLGGAVVEGLRVARAPWVCVMDGDLQHPPELIPRLLAKTQDTNLDLVIATRRSTQSNVQGLNHFRTAVSQGLEACARLLFPAQIQRISDPLTGFFLVRRAALDLAQLQPRGFKILLEMLVRFPTLRAVEVPFHFGKRHAGQSKAGVNEGLAYLAHIWRLRWGESPQQFIKFLLVGASGVLVNSLLLALTTEVLGLHYLLSTLVATVGSTLWNFGLTEAWVFGNRQSTGGLWGRLSKFFVLNQLALAVRAPLMVLLTSGLGLHYLVSNLVSLAVLTLARFICVDKWIWRTVGEPTRRPTPYTHQPQEESLMSTPITYSYNIHDIITLVSEVPLPELEGFYTPIPLTHPDIRVQLGRTNAPPKPSTATLPIKSKPPRVYYDEGLGPVGFWAEITLGQPIELVAAPLLRFSPHVLYTNLVEPILRWTFVQRGYALVHGACVSFGNKAYLITAKTDTGKTTTLLRILHHQRRGTDKGAFISDDLTLVSPEGIVLTYPKPLTISAHTVKAVNMQRLPWWQRLQLLVQSQVHSRGSRQVALGLLRTRLPMATINALVQWLVPPPKYHVQELLPNVKKVKQASLAGMFVIERGETHEERPLPNAEALEVLLHNCEDAYGFPPYHAIREFLYRPNGCDLRTVERAIISQAMRHCPTMLIRTHNLEWWRRIPTFIQGVVPTDFERRKQVRTTHEAQSPLPTASSTSKA